MDLIKHKLRVEEEFSKTKETFERTLAIQAELRERLIRLDGQKTLLDELIAEEKLHSENEYVSPHSDE